MMGIYKKQTSMWTTKDGTKIRICDMEESHIINCIRMLERNLDKYKSGVDYPMLQGEIAQETAERAYENLMELTAEDAYPIYSKLEKELLGRGYEYNQHGDLKKLT